MNSFLEILQTNLGEHSPKEIDELVLDNFWKNKESLTKEEKIGLEQYTNLVHLSLNNLGLKSLILINNGKRPLSNNSWDSSKVFSSRLEA